MPFVWISLLRGKSPEYIQGLQAAAHDALVGAFGMPSDDDFGVVDQYEPHEMVFHRTFRNSGPRSDDCVFFTFTDGVDRGEAAKRHFYKLLVELVGKRPGLRPEDVFVIIHMETRINFSFGEGVSGVETFEREQLDRAATRPGSRDAWTNEEIIEAIRSSFADGDRSRLLQMLADDVVLSAPPSLTPSGEVTGPPEFDALLARVVGGEAGAPASTVVKRVIDAGDHVVVQLGAEATNSAAWVFDLSGGRVVRAQVYADTAAGVHAAG